MVGSLLWDVDRLYFRLPELLGLEDETLFLFLSAEYFHDGRAAHPVCYLQHEAVLDTLVEVGWLIVLKHFFEHL